MLIKFFMIGHCHFHTCFTVQMLILFLNYLQVILNFGCSPSTNLNTSSVKLFEEDVTGSHASLLGVEMVVPRGKCYGTFISKTE